MNTLQDFFILFKYGYSFDKLIIMLQQCNTEPK